MDTGRRESKRWSGRGLLDSLNLPRPSTSSTPSRPSAPLYRPQWSSSPPTSPTFGPPRTPDMRHSSRPAYRLPSFKETFGRMSFDPHLSDDEAPPSSDIGYTHSEYDYSDPGTPDDRLPSIPVDSPPPEDIPFDRRKRAHRLSVSSEHEEEAILGLLDLRTRPRVSSFASDRSAPDLVPTISPETENETSQFPMTPDRSSTDLVDGCQVKIEEEVRDLQSLFFRSIPNSLSIRLSSWMTTNHPSRRFQIQDHPTLDKGLSRMDLPNWKPFLKSHPFPIRLTRFTRTTSVPLILMRKSLRRPPHQFPLLLPRVPRRVKKMTYLRCTPMFPTMKIPFPQLLISIFYLSSFQDLLCQCRERRSDQCLAVNRGQGHAQYPPPSFPPP